MSNYSENGYAVSVTAGPWMAISTYGHPAPFIEFFADGGATVTGRLDISAGGSTFTFASAELYSSTTRIPYVMTGTLNGAMVFSIADELGNTYGNFKQVANLRASLPIDALSITLTNAAATCCRNLMGIDNVVVIR